MSTTFFSNLLCNNLDDIYKNLSCCPAPPFADNSSTTTGKGESQRCGFKQREIQVCNEHLVFVCCIRSLLLTVRLYENDYCFYRTRASCERALPDFNDIGIFKFFVESYYILLADERDTRICSGSLSKDFALLKTRASLSNHQKFIDEKHFVL